MIATMPDVSNALLAAAVLGAVAVTILAAVARLHRGVLGVLGVAAPLVAALPALFRSTPDSLPLLLVLGGCTVCAFLRGDDLASRRHRGEAVALRLLAGAGACVLATADDWPSLLLGFEAMSLALAVLAGNGRGANALDGAFRFFVLSAVAAATLVFGLAMQFAATGTFALGAAPAQPGLAAMATAGVVLAAVGIGFELGIVPFHLGTLAIVRPAPVGCVAFAVLVSKTAAAFALARVVRLHPSSAPVVAGLGAATIVWAALGGLAQRSARGLLAYSAIGHAGFLALAAAGGDPTAVAFNAAVYVSSAALVVAAWNGDGDELTLADYGRRPLGASRRAAMVLGLTSLAGIPPTPGFLAKVVVLRTAWPAAGTAITAIAALGGVVAVLFYLRPVPHLLAGPRAAADATPITSRVAIALAGSAGVTFAIAPHLAAWVR